jgi:threonylcarbamoyladenosine tRNA methylthiotransferase MtaB
MKKKVAFKTLGCRLNQFETDSVMTDFYKSGYDIVNFSEKADIYIINTCTVTGQGDHKSKAAINQALRQNAGRVVIATGCLAAGSEKDLSDIKGLTYIVDNKNKSDIISLVEGHFNGEISGLSGLKSDVFGYSVAEKSFHTRGMVKIQDGCNNFCSYCIVPVVRGRAVSRPAGLVLDNVKQLISLGYREIVLTGVNISRYISDDTDFTDLTGKILDIPGDFRVRISSTEPEGFDNRFYDLFGNSRLCPHLHMCLQSGSDRILSGMRRRYNVSSFMGIIDEIRKRHPLFNFTTDIIVGFPGETEDDFRDTCRIAEEAGFSHIHTFKYSVRSGTQAAKMENHVSEKVKSERSRIIREISETNKKRYRQKFIGRNQKMLVEKTDREGNTKGYGENYIPLTFRSQIKDKNYFADVLLKEIDMRSKDLTVRAEKI